MTAEEFTKIVGREPELDDLERANCPKAGSLGHQICGICVKCGRPRFVCGHIKGAVDTDIHDNT